jgi:hypothetical protein
MTSKAGANGEISITTSSAAGPDIQAGDVWLSTPSTNSGKVYVGHVDSGSVTVKDGTTDTTSGVELAESVIFGPLKIANLKYLTFIGTDADDSVLYLITR